MRTFGACGGMRMHPVQPPWLRACRVINQYAFMDPFISSQKAVLEWYNVICCTDTRNQTFSAGEEKLFFSCANFVDQTKRPNVNVENLPLIIIPSHVTNKGAYQVTHGIFSLIAIH